MFFTALTATRRNTAMFIESSFKTGNCFLHNMPIAPFPSQFACELLGFSPFNFINKIEGEEEELAKNAGSILMLLIKKLSSDEAAEPERG